MRSDFVTKEFLLRHCRINERGCWEWMRNKTNAGYGMINVDKKTKMVHRLAFELWVSQIPAGLFVCHKCDNPPCFNPEHLFTATPLENSRDMVAKGRSIPPHRIYRGESHPGHKLSNEQVILVRKLYVPQKLRLPKTRYISRKELAKQLNISEVAVKEIVSGKRWRHLLHLETPTQTKGKLT